MEEFLNFAKRLIVALLIATGLIALVEMSINVVRMVRRLPESRLSVVLLIAVTILVVAWLALRSFGYF